MMKLVAAAILLWAVAAVGQTTAPPAQSQPSATQSTTPSFVTIRQNEEPGVRKAKELVNKMIQALGGQAYLDIQDVEQSGRTYSFFHGDPTGAGAPYWDFWKWPDKERVELLKTRDWVIIHNGDKGYETTFRGTVAEEKKQLEDYLRRRHYSLPEVLRNWIKQPGTIFLYEGPATADRKPAEQVSILNAQNEGVTLYINQDTFLPIKKTFEWRDPKTRDRNDEGETYDNYRSVQGIMTPFSITRQSNGMTANQRFINDVKYNQNMPDSMFQATITKPAAGPEKHK
jgi:hypothetical protein